MGNILDQIVADKRNEVIETKKRLPIETIQNQAETVEPPRNFHAAITRKTDIGINLIAEIKRKSPSAGLIREDFNPPAIARIYKEAGASAISVLTDTPYFDGKLEYIAQVKNAVDLPVLRKDFIVDPYQLWEAKAAGADAVLLISEVLGPEGVREYAEICAYLKLTALIEAYQPELLQAVLKVLGTPLPSNVLIGINNRDLTIQKTDISTTKRLAETMADTSVLVSESGIKTREDVQYVQQAGARAILVGETIMAAPDMAQKIKELLGT